jgi:hypothetical protein
LAVTDVERFVTSRQVVEQITLVFPVEERERVSGWLESEGLEVVSGGPYTNANMWPEHDLTRRSILCERVLQR